MSEESVNQSGNEDPEPGLATREILEKWLAYDSMSLWHAALIAHRASPAAEGLGLSADREAAVRETREFLSRSIELKLLKTVGDQELYKTSEVFQELANKGHKFPALVREILLKNNLIRPTMRRQPVRHGNVERFEEERIQVMYAMIRVLADPALHPTCRENAATDGPVVGIALARTIVANRQVLFDGGKLPQQPETIAKLFNDIVPPQIR